MRSANEILGAILIAIGALVLLGTTDMLDLGFGWGQFVRTVIALAVLGGGIWLLWGSGALRGRPAADVRPPGGPGTREGWPGWTAAGVPPGGSAPAGFAGQSRLLGRLVVGGPFTLAAARYETIIGEAWIDLSATTVPEGETPIRVSSLLGSLRVLLPAGAGALVRGEVLAGGLELFGHRESGIAVDRVMVTDEYATSRQRIRLDVSALVGNVAVRRVGGAPASPPPSPSASPSETGVPSGSTGS